MSASVARNPDLPEGAQSPRPFNFAPPTALNVEVKGQDQVTGENVFQVNAPNAILSGILDLNQATQSVKYEFYVRRQRQNIHTIPDDAVKYDLQYVSPLFPLNLAPGTYQLIMIQTVGSPAARKLTLLLQLPLT